MAITKCQIIIAFIKIDPKMGNCCVVNCKKYHAEEIVNAEEIKIYVKFKKGVAIIYKM